MKKHNFAFTHDPIHFCLATSMGFTGSSSSMWEDAKFLEPIFYTQNSTYCTVSRQILAPQNSSVSIHFNLLVHGKLDEEEENKFIQSNIEFQFELNNGENPSQVVDLEVLQPQNDEWKSYEVSFRTDSEEPTTITFSSMKRSEKQHVILRNITLSWAPLLSINIIRPLMPVSTTAPQTSSEKPSTAAVSHESSPSTNNSSVASDGASTSAISTTTTSSMLNVTTVQQEFGNETQPTGTPLKDDGNQGSIGYTGEVFLVIVVVVLIICFSVVSTKYYFLQKNIGAYRVSNTNTATSTASSNYSNPSFHE